MTGSVSGIAVLPSGLKEPDTGTVAAYKFIAACGNARYALKPRRASEGRG